MKKKDGKRLFERLTNIRRDIQFESPFYGKLLLSLTLASGNCGTACTDMKRMIFDPAFCEKLSDKELKFVMLHELLHCVLLHPIRGKDFEGQFIYNTACDIVINSLLMNTYREFWEITIDGEVPMHLTPEGKQGYLYTTEEVYHQLLKYPIKDDTGEAGGGLILTGAQTLDNHDIWDTEVEGTTAKIWKKRIEGAMNMTEVPGYIKQMVERNLVLQDKKSKLDWRKTLNDFLRCFDEDYSYMVPDKRYLGDFEFIMPSLISDDIPKILSNVWVCVDTSGSIEDKELADAFTEIISIFEQIGNVSVKISFFDTDITKPVIVDSVDIIKNIVPVGGGGTSFLNVFESIQKYFPAEPPSLIIMMTDGYAPFPNEEKALGIPVIWLIIDRESEIEAPFGTVIHVSR